MDPVEKKQSYDDSRRAVLELLIEHAFSKRRVTLSSGKESDFYINCKKALTSKGLYHIGALFYAEMEQAFYGDGWSGVNKDGRVRPTDVHGVGGLTMGADPLAVATSFAAARARHFDLWPFYVRKEPKKHGTENWLEGPNFAENTLVVIIEDVITTGASTIKAIERVRTHNLVPTLVVALVDRQEENGRANIEALGVPVRTVFTRTDFPL